MLASGPVGRRTLECAHCPALWPGPGSILSATGDTLGEVMVEGTRRQQQQMRLELQRIETRFYARYNELNTDDEFDIDCADEALTGTAFRNRSCQPRFVADISATYQGR